MNVHALIDSLKMKKFDNRNGRRENRDIMDIVWWRRKGMDSGKKQLKTYDSSLYNRSVLKFNGYSFIIQLLQELNELHDEG